jgi:glycosyltransferase involved in cell wall biosynthesis
MLFLVKHSGKFLLGGAEKQSLLIYDYVREFVDAEALYVTKENRVMDENGKSISFLSFIRTLTGKEQKIVYVRNRGTWVSVLVMLKLLTRRFKILYWTAENYSCHRSLRNMGPGIYLEHFIFTKLLRFVDAVICQTEYQQSQYLKNFNISSIVIRNVIPGIEDRFMDSDHVARKYNSNSYVWIGKLTVWKKRFDKLLDIARQYPRVAIGVIGPWNDVEDPDEITAHLNTQGMDIPHNVHLYGKLPESECASIIDKARFLISTSQPQGEGFPNTFLEAWKLGTPVFSLQYDPDQIIERHELGFVEAFERCLEMSFDRYVQVSRNSHLYCKTFHNMGNLVKVQRVIEELSG